MERRYEIDNLRRSVAMLSPGANALDREKAFEVLGELVEAYDRLDDLRDRLRKMADEG